MAASTSQTFSEDRYGRKLDRCLTDTLVKFGGGIALGGLVSLLFLRRRAWPVLMGGGFGVGVAYTNCEKSLNEK